MVGLGENNTGSGHDLVFALVLLVNNTLRSLSLTHIYCTKCDDRTTQTRVLYLCGHMCSVCSFSTCSKSPICTISLLETNVHALLQRELSERIENALLVVASNTECDHVLQDETGKIQHVTSLVGEHNGSTLLSPFGVQRLHEMCDV